MIILRLEYLHKITLLTEKQCHIIERRAIALIKNKVQLPITANDNIIFNDNLLDIKRLWDNYKGYHITSLTQRFNNISTLNDITEIWLKHAQLFYNSHVPVFDLSITQLQQLDFKYNLAIHELIAAKSMGINIKVNKNEFNSSASDSGLTCHETINTHIKMI